nr:MAG TPA: hypothetical protein [Caudoviricetes sp.]
MYILLTSFKNKLWLLNPFHFSVFPFRVSCSWFW